MKAVANKMHEKWASQEFQILCVYCTTNDCYCSGIYALSAAANFETSLRWFSLSACASRILDQGKALHLYFQLAHTEDRLHSSDFLYSKLSNSYTHLYFQFLEYILSVTDKLNVIF